MAATNDTNNAERHKQWYDPDIISVNQDIRTLLEKYSHVPPGKVVEHINEIRARGFQANPYPCIGHYRFLNLTLLTHPLYDDLVQRLKASPSSIYLDVGCCFGQDLRQLVYDGVPSAQLIGLDIEGPLMELGYDLFMDREMLKSKFIVGDVFAGSSQGDPWSQLTRTGADVVHCSAFFHLFPLSEQFKAAKNMVQLIKVGGVMVGRQSGSVRPGEVPAIKAGTTSYRHDVETWRNLWDGVGEDTGTTWKVTGTLDMTGQATVKKSNVEDENSRRLLFTVERTG